MASEQWVAATVVGEWAEVLASHAVVVGCVVLVAVVLVAVVLGAVVFVAVAFVSAEREADWVRPTRPASTPGPAAPGRRTVRSSSSGSTPDRPGE